MEYEFTLGPIPDPQKRPYAPRTYPERYESTCPNCGDRFRFGHPQSTYCGLPCSSEAEAVRYARKKVIEFPNDSWPEDVEYAIRVQIAHVLNGGYNRTERRLSDETRAAVFERDGGLCQMCGESGEDIDHIQGPSNKLGNLRLLCKDCHAEMTAEHFGPIQDPEVLLHASEIWRRIRLPEPERPSDAVDWSKHRKAWAKEHRSLAIASPD